MDNKIVLYSTNCPNCRMLEKKLTDANIKFDICTDMEVMKEKNITSAPSLEINGKIYTFFEANQWLKNVKRGEN